MNLHEIDIREFLDRIRNLPPSQRYGQDDLLVDKFLLHRDGSLEIYYAPFDHINLAARVALIGVTPGWTQMELSFRTVHHALGTGGTLNEALSAVKQEAAFGGPMRRNLVTMLDDIAVADSLGIATTDMLFRTRSELLHPTSAIRYPVFSNGKNYSGHAPKIDSHPLLRQYVEELLASELDQTEAALVIPLGRAASQATESLIGSERLQAERVLRGFPHPSGLNPHRLPAFIRHKEHLQETVRAWFAR